MTYDEALEIHFSGQEEVIRVICDLSSQVTALENQVKKQQETIAKLSKNSSNSSRRPSSDDITKPKSKKGKDEKGKGGKIGGQPGHPKKERPPFKPEEIDKFHDYMLNACPTCNGDGIILDLEPRIIQQVEQEITIKKIEHRSYAFCCADCDEVHYKEFPPEVVKQGLFANQITATVAYMKHVCHASFSTIRKFFLDIADLSISRGYLSKVIAKVSASLEKPYEELLKSIPLESQLNVDETGHKENGKRFWTWVFKADLYVLFRIDKSRGSKVLIDTLGEEFDGIIGCDYFSAYRKYMKDFNVMVQFCIAHLIRDIKFLLGLPDEETKKYGQKLLKCIKELFKVIHNRDKFGDAEFTSALQQIRKKTMSTALNNVPSSLDKNGKEQKRAAQNIAKRFKEHGEQYFQFITTPGVDPTNNVAEQAIRFIVIDRYVTQGTRSKKGRQNCERIWSVIATCALQGRSAYEFILKAVEAYFCDHPAPSLIPNTS